MTTEFAQKIKAQSFELHNSIEKALATTSDDDTFFVSGQDLRSWKKRAKSINIALTRFVRSVNDTKVRHLTEMNVLREAVRLDIIDREASYSQTLAVLRESECEAQIGVERALRAVSKQAVLLAAVSEVQETVSFKNIKICEAGAELKDGELLLMPDPNIVPTTRPEQPAEPAAPAPPPDPPAPVAPIGEQPGPSTLPPLQPQIAVAKHAAVRICDDSSDDND